MTIFLLLVLVALAWMTVRFLWPSMHEYAVRGFWVGVVLILCGPSFLPVKLTADQLNLFYAVGAGLTLGEVSWQRLNVWLRGSPPKSDPPKSEE